MWRGSCTAPDLRTLVDCTVFLQVTFLSDMSWHNLPLSHQSCHLASRTVTVSATRWQRGDSRLVLLALLSEIQVWIDNFITFIWQVDRGRQFSLHLGLQKTYILRVFTPQCVGFLWTGVSSFHVIELEFNKQLKLSCSDKISVWNYSWVSINTAVMIDWSDVYSTIQTFDSIVQHISVHAMVEGKHDCLTSGH